MKHFLKFTACPPPPPPNQAGENLFWLRESKMSSPEQTKHISTYIYQSQKNFFQVELFVAIYQHYCKTDLQANIFGLFFLCASNVGRYVRSLGITWGNYYNVLGATTLKYYLKRGIIIYVSGAIMAIVK